MGRARIVASGYYLPEKILTNYDLEKMVDTSDEWITKRTGIKQRHIAGRDEAASDLATKAALAAMDKVGCDPLDIDMVICASITGDYITPSTACVIQKNLGLANAACFDVSAACSGFIYALTIAEKFILSDNDKTILVVASEKLSTITDWEDRSTCVLFGDGAGAAILKYDESGKRGILSSCLKSDGTLGELLMVPGGGSRLPISPGVIKNREQYLRMKGNDVFKAAVHRMSEAAAHVMELAKVDPHDVRMFFPHQANMRIIYAIARKMKIDKERIFVNLHKTGNTSAATIAIALAEADEQKLIKENDILVLVSFGAGFTWAGMCLKW